MCATHRIIAVLLAIGLVAGMSLNWVWAEPVQKDESLPKEALARLGSNRWVHDSAVQMTAFSADGKKLSTVADVVVRCFDLASGKELHRFKLPEGQECVALSADGRRVAATEGMALAKVWDVETGKELFKLQEKANPAALAAMGGAFSGLAFSKDGSVLVVKRNLDMSIRVLDAATGTEKCSIEAPEAEENKEAPVPFPIFPGMGSMALPAGVPVLSADGKCVALAANQKVHVWDAATGKVLRKCEEVDGADCGQSPALSDDGTMVALRQFDGMQIWDNGKEGPKIKDEALKNHAPLFFGPKNDWLAARAGESIVLWDIKAEKVLHHFHDPVEAEAVPPQQLALVAMVARPKQHALALSPDGKLLAVGRFNMVKVYDLATGKPQGTSSKRSRMGAVAATTDGKTVVTIHADRDVQLWSAANSKEAEKWSLPGAANAVALSADATTIAYAHEDRTIRFVEALTGNEVAKSSEFPNPHESLALSADGKILAAKGMYSSKFVILDAATGKEIHKLDPDEVKADDVVVPIFPNVLKKPLSFSTDIAISDDGKMVAVVRANHFDPEADPEAVPAGPTLTLWDAQKGKKLQEIETQLVQNAMPGFGGRKFKPGQPWVMPTPPAQTLLIAPNGRSVAWLNGTALSVYEVLSGKERCQHKVAPGEVLSMSFSPDSTCLAMGIHDGTVRVWNLAGSDAANLEGHQASAACVRYACNGQVLLSASSDTSAVLWDAAALKKDKKAAELSQTDLNTHWNFLGEQEAAKPFDAIRALATSSKETVTFFKDKIKTEVVPDARLIPKLIADLDSEQFDIRNKADEELTRFSSAALEPLRKVLKEQASSLELRRRVERIIEKLKSTQISTADLRTGRMVEVLETMATPEARELLEEIAKRDAAGSAAAKAALVRMPK